MNFSIRFCILVHVFFSESLIWWSKQAGEAHCAEAELSCVYGIFTLKKDRQLKGLDPNPRLYVEL